MKNGIMVGFPAVRSVVERSVVRNSLQKGIGLSLIAFSFLLIVPVSLKAQTLPYTGMVSFGDSLSDGGNLNSALSSITERTAQFLTGWDPDYYYNHRFSNGPIWVDYLYTRLGFGDIGTMAPNDGVENMEGTNFAWAGSRSGTGEYGLIFPNLLRQVEYYSNQRGENPFLPDPGTTLFTIWSGANDVFASVESGDPVTPTEVANNIITAITLLYAEGGRSFLVPNLPPIGLIPAYANEPIKADLASAFVSIVNETLDAELELLATTLPDIKLFELDVYELFLEIMDNYVEYGFTNVTDTAYIRFGDRPYEPRDPPYGAPVSHPDGYFYWDAAHGTTLTNSLIAKAAYQAVIPEPTALFCLILAAFGMLLRRHFVLKPVNTRSLK